MREAIPQMTRIGDIGDALDAIKHRLSKLEAHGSNPPVSDTNDANNSSPYVIGQSERAEDSIVIPLWVHSRGPDPAVKVRQYIPDIEPY